MVEASAAIRLGTKGAPEVKADLASIGDAGASAGQKAADSFDQASERITRKAAALAKVQVFAPDINLPQSGSAVSALMAREEELQRRTDALRASIDPAAAAQQRFNARMAEAQALVSRGAIGLDEYVGKLGLERRALQEAENAARGHGSALGLNRIQMMEGESALIRFSDAVMAGRNPLQALAVEGHKVVEMVSSDDGGMAGGLAKVKALLSPTNLLIGGFAIAASLAAVEAVKYSESVAKLGAAAEGSGRLLGLSGGQLEEVANQAADAGHMTVGAARDIETGFLGVARSGEVLEQATVLTRDFAAATGGDAKQATADLAKVLDDPIRGLEEMQQKYGDVTEAQIDYVRELVEEGRATDAQKAALDALGPSFAGAADKAHLLGGAWAEIKSEASQAGEMMGWALSVGASIYQAGTGKPAGLVASFIGSPSKPDPTAARAASDGQKATDLSRAYQHDDRIDAQKRIGTLQAAITENWGKADQTANIARWTEAMAANQHALQTWVPAAEKQNNIIAANTRLRQAATPQARAAARAQLEEAKAAGEVVTAANVALRVQDRAEGFHNRANASAGKHAETLKREADAMSVNAAEALKVGDAYLTSAAAGELAEAKRKAATDATKKGIDVEAEARRQLALNVAEQVASSGKTVAGMRDETAARTAVLAQITAGVTSVDDMDRALGDEAALRSLITLRTFAQGDALASLNRMIDAYRAALADAHKVEDQMGLDKAMQASRDAIAETVGAMQDLGKSPLDRALGAAQRAANDQADKLHLAPGSTDRVNFVRQKENEAQAKYDGDRARFLIDQKQSQADSLELSQREAALAGASDATRTAELDKLKLQQSIRRTFPDMAKADVDGLLAGITAIDKQNEKTKLLQQSWSEVQSAGDRFIDDLTHPNGDGIKSLLKDIEQELEKLALINPLKNLLLGEKNPTLGGLFSALSGGGKSLDISSIEDMNRSYDVGAHNADGTQDWSGGRTWLNENGPEIADLPTGTRIYPAAESRRMMQAANENNGRSRVDIHLNTPLFEATVSDTADRRVGAAAPGIAAGGAQMASINAGRQRRRQLGSRG